MWREPTEYLRREMAVGNTFGATALSSYGGFWIAFGIILTPGGFQIEASIEKSGSAAVFRDSFGFFLAVPTHIPLICATFY